MRKANTLTGKHVAAIFAGGFAIVIAVNLTMATMAIGSFHGTVVDNSYVASQNYNGWLKQAAASQALGWIAVPLRKADGRVAIATRGVPAGASLTVTAERPLGQRHETELAFTSSGKGLWVSDQPLAPGRWHLRIAIRAEGKAWAGRGRLP